MNRNMLWFWLVLAAALPAVAAAVECNDTLSCNVELLSVTRDSLNTYSDCWGFTANGDEYAIIGYKRGTMFFRVTDPYNPVMVGYINGPNNLWRDIKTYRDHAYITTEGTGPNQGMQIVDISDPENPFLANTYTGTFTTAHNLYIDTSAARCYVVGTDTGMHILDVGTDPVNPIWLGAWSNHYIHDLFVLNDTAYVSPIFSATMKILDVSDPANVHVLASHFYSSAVNHNAWLMEDHNFLLTSDEANRGHVRCWDISDFTNITETSSYWIQGLTNSAHNVLVKGTVAYISYYKNGLRLVDFADPYNPVEIGYYDTHPEASGATYVGNWGNYPFLPSGTLIASDEQHGLYLLRYNEFTGVAEGIEAAPAPALLLSNRPNPFNPATQIAFTLPERMDLELSIYMPSGQLVRKLFAGTLPGGDHHFSWDGLSESGVPLGSGVYFSRLETAGAAESGKIHLIR